MADSDRPNCNLCEAFFITHERKWPYGCRAFGLKTKGIPSIAVFQSSGMHCQQFTPKPASPVKGKQRR